MMGVMAFKAHGKIVTRFIRDSSLAVKLGWRIVAGSLANAGQNQGLFLLIK